MIARNREQPSFKCQHVPRKATVSSSTRWTAHPLLLLLHLQIFVQELSASSGRCCSIPSRVVRQQTLISQRRSNESACWREAPSHRTGLIWHVNIATHGAGRGVYHRPCERPTGAAVNWQRTLVGAAQNGKKHPDDQVLDHFCVSWTLIHMISCFILLLWNINVWHVWRLFVIFVCWKLGFDFVPVFAPASCVTQVGGHFYAIDTNMKPKPKGVWLHQLLRLFNWNEMN